MNFSGFGQYGYGIYARHHMFYLNAQGKIVPVLHPDDTRLSDLVDYHRQFVQDGRDVAQLLLAHLQNPQALPVQLVGHRLDGGGFPRPRVGRPGSLWTACCPPPETR